MKTMLIPILTVAAVSSSALKTFADLERKDSSQFDYKYEMLKLPTAEDIDGNAMPAMLKTPVAFGAK